MQTYEVEVKALLGEEARARKLRAALQTLDPACVMRAAQKQLNHYFEGGQLRSLYEKAKPLLSKEAAVKLADLAARAKSFSVRTRAKDDEVLLVVKASVDETTSENGIARMEFEERVSLPFAELDKLVLSAGFRYQAKWSREREEYVCRGTNVTLDRNAGYGWLAEFERIVRQERESQEATREIRALMELLGVEELPQDRLERMFAYYNAHWPEYYGTDNIFVIE